MRRERVADRVDRHPVAPLAEIRHRLERQHGRTLGGGGRSDRARPRVDAPRFALKRYYDRRAPEYDDWYRGAGLYADRQRPGWDEELAELTSLVSSLPPGRTLDVACGTGFLTRHLRGDVVALDQSAAMLDEARRLAPRATLVRGDAFALPFLDRSFDRVFTAHFYGHLDPDERERFLAEARRVALELVVVDSALREDNRPEEVQTRVLKDGTRWEVLKRCFTVAGLSDELGGGEVLHDGDWFVAVRAVT